MYKIFSYSIEKSLNLYSIINSGKYKDRFINSFENVVYFYIILYIIYKYKFKIYLRSLRITGSSEQLM